MRLSWRLTLVVLLIGSASAYPLQVTLIPLSGDFGFSTDYEVANAPSITRHVIGVDPDSPAWRADVRSGDALPLSGVDRNSRVALKFVLPGDHARYDVRRGSQLRQVHLVARSSAQRAPALPFAIRTFVVYCLIVFALLVVLRAWNSEYGPLIATILTVMVVDATVDRIPWVPQTANAIGGALLGHNAGLDAIATALSILLPIVLVGRLTKWHSLQFRFAAGCVAVVAAIVVAYCPVGLVLQHNGGAGAFAEFANDWLLNVLPFPTAAIALLVAYRTARGQNQQRLRWVFWGFTPYLVGVALLNVIVAVAPISNWDSSQSVVGLIIRSIFRLMGLALPIALFYGVMMRRVVDLGFVFNRVAVYGALSFALAAMFVLLEYAVSHFALETNRVGSLVIQLTIALGIGLSAKYVHQIVDRVVDRLFFAKRHSDARTLRRFAREADAYTTEKSLLDRTLENLREHTDTRGASVYLVVDGYVRAVRASGPEFPASIDLDDPLLIKLRRWNEPIDTGDVKTEFPDGMVFPLSVRGKWLGALACETKRDNSAFDPDERESLTEVARGVGIALDALSSKSDGAIAALQESMAAMADSIVTSLSEKIDSLRSEIDEKR
jgi:hypothetical protein